LPLAPATGIIKTRREQLPGAYPQRGCSSGTASLTPYLIPVQKQTLNQAKPLLVKLLPVPKPFSHHSVRLPIYAGEAAAESP